MDLTAVSKWSASGLAILTVFWCCVGGIHIGQGIQRMIHSYSSYNWVVDFLSGSALLGMGIFWAVMLVRRVKTTTSEAP